MLEHEEVNLESDGGVLRKIVTTDDEALTGLGVAAARKLFGACGLRAETGAAITLIRISSLGRFRAVCLKLLLCSIQADPSILYRDIQAACDICS